MSPLEIDADSPAALAVIRGANAAKLAAAHGEDAESQVMAAMVAYSGEMLAHVEQMQNMWFKRLEQLRLFALVSVTLNIILLFMVCVS